MESNNLDCITDLQWSCKTWRRNGFKVNHAEPNQLKRRKEVFEISYAHKKTQDPFLRTIHWNPPEAREELDWNHERSTPQRSETHGIARRAAQRVKEGSSSVSVQSALQESWWLGAMECLLLSSKCARPSSR